jgi:hypothetical protein
MFYLPYIVILILFGQLGLVLWQQPGYGQADDGTLLKICANPDNLGLLQSFSQFVIEDKNWGMLRPVYFWMIQALYCTTKFHPTWLYFLNAIFVFGIFALLAAALLRTLPDDRKLLPPSISISLMLLLSLCVYRTHDIFATPALQEKLVLLAGAFCIYVFTLPKEKWIWLGLPLSLFLGFSTKAQFLLFLPALFLLLIIKRRSGAFYFYFFFFAFAGMGLVKWIAQNGSYTNRYSLQNVWANLSSRQALLLVALSLLSIFLELKKSSKPINLAKLGQKVRTNYGLGSITKTFTGTMVMQE